MRQFLLEQHTVAVRFYGVLLLSHKRIFFKDLFMRGKERWLEIIFKLLVRDVKLFENLVQQTLTERLVVHWNRDVFAFIIVEDNVTSFPQSLVKT